ncbi:MAG: TIGR03620 family F420-dependent LLM class oxidoreductase [Candidatus Binatia bacterium]|nr:TIGR03620 family F420-dependent LLM class oxidoreductase [Candidatus Binatia bacterium]MDG1959999.1 TIGR03620 family F420-dependent LLM class oxidoreductase [Candidatus Binatia bacterium]MDG2009785.1 TIGR03620 family F420-dependent LLM class oxidoreductase [Candidatus Binatia bacterium]HAC80013.1 LLM class F420-dependent oxidoreductase [Deltaproteobacteria bacterium]
MTGKIGIWFAPEGLTSPQSAAMAQLVEKLGYHSLWIGETFGRDPFSHLAFLGTCTDRLVLAPGIANIYNRHPGVMQQAAHTLAEQLPGRFVLGLGVSSPVIVSKIRGLEYSRPYSFMVDYLEKMASSRYFSVPPANPAPIILGALAPRMMALSAAKGDGAHTYNVSPAHTRWAREILGPDKSLCVEQKVLLQEDPTKARAIAKSALDFYARAPGYRNAWKRLGFTENDIDSGSPEFLDAIVAWGSADSIRERIHEHFEAGASEVLLHPLHPELGMGMLDENTLRTFAPQSS